MCAAVVISQNPPVAPVGSATDEPEAPAEIDARVDPLPVAPDGPAERQDPLRD